MFTTFAHHHRFRFSVLTALTVLIVVGVLLSSCGDEGERSFNDVTLVVKVAGFYVTNDAPLNEKTKLRIGLFGLNEQNVWMQVAVGTVYLQESYYISVLVIDQKPDSSIIENYSGSGFSYQPLELRAFLDLDSDGAYSIGEPFVDGYPLAAYQSKSYQWLYFFHHDAPDDGAVYGYNFHNGSEFSQAWDTQKPTDTPPRFLVETKEWTGR